MKPAITCLLLIFAFILLASYYSRQEVPRTRPPTAGNSKDNLIDKAGDTSKEWLLHGRNYYEDRYSPLEQISRENIGQLGLAWSLNLGTKRGIEATPLVANGIMYLSGPWSLVYAIDVRSGKLIWKYDPKVQGSYGEKACCDVVNRGVALYKGLVYVGTLDGRLVAIDAKTGSAAWSVATVDTSKPYTITGAPRVIEGKVIIGNGGSDYGVRGYITAYDATTGKQAWRFYIVPGNPKEAFENDAMQMAAKTWNGDWWEYGGGGTAWDGMAYDPELRLLYVGTGNGGPWNREYRSPGGGDNLFLSSILAIDPDNGQLKWYYQTTPGESWDYTATQPMILADLDIDGAQRKVIMQAPKNGFFYVLDRVNGKFISAKPYAYVNWAKEIDPNTGRPIESDFSRYKNVNTVIFPHPIGAHGWQPMAFNKKTKWVYLTVRDMSMVYGQDKNWKYNQPGFIGSGTGLNTGITFDPSKPVRQDTLAPREAPQERLIAWDPVKQQEVWRAPLKGICNGGVVTTASGLVFEGGADGKLRAFDAENGKILWEVNIGSGIIGTPNTYEVGGKQYVSIAVGWGGVAGLGSKFTEQVNPGTVYTFALNEKTPMPVFAKQEPKHLVNLPFSATKEELSAGSTLYLQYCTLCHGGTAQGGGALPDLAYSNEGIHKIFKDIVLKGLLVSNGMPNFGNRLNEEKVTAIHNYILSKAKEQIAKQVKIAK
jgi:quinohemoprotein ethanol dehydrogenase